MSPRLSRKAVKVENSNEKPRIHLDFGCGEQPRNPFKANEIISVDIYRTSELIPTEVIRPGDALPFSDSTFDSVSAYDVLEHLSRDAADGRNLYIFYMNELHRVLKTNGKAVFIFPHYPGFTAFLDPTHVNFIPKSGVNFFTGSKGGPYYAGIRTSYKIIMNNKLRLWGRWVDKATGAPKPIIRTRRKISLLKRSIIRFIRPSHVIWVLEKN